jgi:hypothetical protein
MSNVPASSQQSARPLVIPSHPHSFFGLTFDTRYIVDAMLVIAGLGALFVSLALIAEPDVSSLIKKAGGLGLDAAAVA